MIAAGFNNVGDAGWFEDNFPPSYHTDLCLRALNEEFGSLNAKLGHIKHKWGDRAIVLGLSGCFAPFHKGHLEMLKLAKRQFQWMGYKVYAVIFPAHDSYALTKKGNSLRIDERRKIIETEIEGNEDWVFVDCGPAWYLPNEVNFPWLIERLEVIADHINAETGFVFGEDNAQFALAFIDSPTWAVCIERKGGWEKVFPHLNSRIKYKFIKGNGYKDESSSKIRGVK